MQSWRGFNFCICPFLKATNLQNIWLFSQVRSSVTKSRKVLSNQSQQQRRKIEREKASSSFWYSSYDGTPRPVPSPQLPHEVKILFFTPFLRQQSCATTCLFVSLSLSPLWSLFITSPKIVEKIRLLLDYIQDFWKYQAMEKSHNTGSLKTKIKTLPSSAIVRLLGLLWKAALWLSWMLHPAGNN